MPYPTERWSTFRNVKKPFTSDMDNSLKAVFSMIPNAYLHVPQPSHNHSSVEPLLTTFLRCESPLPASSFPRPLSLPLFARNPEPLTPIRGDGTKSLPVPVTQEMNSLASLSDLIHASDSPVKLEREDCIDWAKENMAIVDGWSECIFVLHFL